MGITPSRNTCRTQFLGGNQCKILGINFQVKDLGRNQWDLNFAPAIQKMDRVCRSWRFRNLSLKGRVVVLNTLVLPIFYYPSTMLATPPKAFKEIDRVISSFLWRGRKPKISRKCLEKPTREGGVGLHNVRSRIKASKMSWLKRLTLPPSEPWHYYFEFRLDQPGLEVALQRSRSRKLARSSSFFTEIYTYWRELAKTEPSSDLAVRNEFLWGNPFLKGKLKKNTRLGVDPWESLGLMTFWLMGSL